MRQKWPNPGQPTALWVRLELAIATAQLGSGDAKAAAATAKALRELLQQQHAATGSAFRTAAELEALAVARQGDRAGAAAALALGDSASPAPPFASPVERADSRLRRAEVLAALGRADAAATAARPALADLATQHPDSPRLRDARRLAGVVSAVRWTGAPDFRPAAGNGPSPASVARLNEAWTWLHLHDVRSHARSTIEATKTSPVIVKII
ncbi:MAG: hypothetical protein H7276_23345 [Caulobacter sp.]|nr:hypothetical protein [Vitreoscilla sp.]